MANVFHKKILWTITLGELLLWLLFCACFAGVFYSILLQTGYIFLYTDGRQSVIPAIAVEIMIEYFNKALFTLPLWYLFFIALKDIKLWQTLLLHLLTLPLFLFAWKTMDRLMADMMSLMLVLDRSALWFDYFFPMMFYLIQFGIFHTYNFWLHTQKQYARERDLVKLAHQSELKSLKAQIQPHFLFNTLNSISASVPPEQESTRELIAKLAHTFRYALRATEKEWIPLEEEIKFIITLLELEQERFGDRLHFEVRGDYTTHAVYIPPMLLQPIVENAIQHSIAPSIQGGSVVIDLVPTDNQMHISVSNTGIPYEGDLDDLLHTKGIGLSNTKQRLELLYGEQVAIKKNEAGGLIFSFNIPMGTRI